MALIFSTELSLGAAATPFLGHEPSNALWQYYMTNKSRAEDKKSTPELGRYDDLVWGSPEQHLTIRAVSRIGVKHFPHIGSIGFYRDKYTGASNILAPIHVARELTQAPAFEASVVDSSLHVIITPPKDTTYQCYRVVMRNEYFADERVVYELDSLLPLPAVAGKYSVYVIGYNDNTNALSARSSEIAINVDTGRASWAPAPAETTVKMRLSDLLDVNIVDLLNDQMLRFNADTQRWENASADSGSSTAGAAAKIVHIDLPAASWSGSDGHYEQPVYIDGVSANSKINLQPTAEQLQELRVLNTSLAVANTGGVVVVHAIGTVPTVDITMQATVTEVIVDE